MGREPNSQWLCQPFNNIIDVENEGLVWRSDENVSEKQLYTLSSEVGWMACQSRFESYCQPFNNMNDTWNDILGDLANEAYYREPAVIIFNADCLDVLPEFKNEILDLIVMDFPYSSGTRQAMNRTAGNIPKRGERWAKAGIIWDTSFSSFGLSIFANFIFQMIKHKLKNGAHIYTFIDWRHYPLLTLSIENSGLFINNLIIWDKKYFALGGNYRSQYELIVFASRGANKELNNHNTGNILCHKRVTAGKHPTQKPKGLLDQILKVASKSNNLILDPFLGSGTTAVASKNLGRKCIGIEIEKKYCDIAIERLRQEVLI